MKGAGARRGLLGEAAARDYLVARGFAVLAERYRTEAGEIDLVAREGNVLVFVEVKLRKDRRFGLPEEALTPAKEARLVAAAEAYLHAHPEWTGPCRFDVVAMEWPPGAAAPTIRHHRNAFDAT